MQLKKSLIALALTSTLAACGSDSSTTTTPDPITVTPPVETVVNGKAIKGVLTNAVVTVYKFVDGAAVALTPEELSDANINTDGEGNYTFTVLDYDGPIKIELSPSTDPANPTTMTCDAPAGCGDTAFGAQIDLTVADPNFKLAAISVVDSDSNGDVKVNVSALTHLAAALIEDDDAGVTADSVTENSAQIASTFGIIGDITQLEPTVTDDAAAVAAEDNDAELRYGLINAGIMAALFSGEAGSTEILSSKLAEVAADLIENDGKFLPSQDDNEDTFELALDDVWNGMAAATSTAAAAIAADNTLTAQVNLAQLETELVNESIFITSNIDTDGFVTIITDVPTEGDAVAKAKKMVEDIRLFSHLFDEETEQGAGIKGQGDEYVALLEAAGVMVETEADSFELLAQLSDTLADLSLAYDEGTLSEAVAAAGVNIATYIEGATGTIIFDETTVTGGILFTVDATSGSEKVQLNVAAEFSEDNKSITLTFDGLLESAGAVFTLNEGSFAKVNLDTAASREAFDDDTYEGEIVSGELELTLSLAQKATDNVPNPITFEGMIKTELLPVKERVLDERWDWDEQNQQDITSYGRPEFETFVLPETLSLSGAFNSLEGDLIEATLTVNVNDLADYQAPDFKYIGKEVEGILNITFTDDAVVWTEADSVNDEEQWTATYSFMLEGDAGNWTGRTFAIPEDPEMHWGGTGYDLKVFSRPFESGLNVPGFIYTKAYVIDYEDEVGYFAKSIRITPVDDNGDDQADGYHFERIDTNDGQNIGLEYNTAAMIDGDGNVNLSALVDADGQILTADGLPQAWTNILNLGTYLTINDFIEARSWDLIGNPTEITSSAEYFANSIGSESQFTVEEIGKATIFFNEEELADIAAGEFTELNPTAYITQALIKDALTVTVSEDANTVTATVEGAFVATKTFSGEAGSDFTYNSEYISTGEDNSATTSIWSAVDSDNGLDVSDVIVSTMVEESWDTFAMQLKFKAVDDQAEGEDGFGIADRINVYFIGGWGNSFNDDGNLIDGDGNVIEFAVESWIITSFDSYDDFDWTTEAWGTEDWGNIGWNPLPFNPLTAANALDIYKAQLLKDPDYRGDHYIEGIGRVEIDLDDDSINAITAGSTTMFDGYNTSADDRTLLENEETFLDVNAALILEAILGDYQVKLQLSGERTALDDGAFDLGMSYRLPGEDEQRSFNVHYNTETEGQLSANNFEGVVLVLEEPEEDVEGTQVIGQILVGPTAIVAATIEDRDGLVVIVYSDETTESL